MTLETNVVDPGAPINPGADAMGGLTDVLIIAIVVAEFVGAGSSPSLGRRRPAPTPARSADSGRGLRLLCRRSKSNLHPGTFGLSAIGNVARRWSYRIDVTTLPERP